MDIITLSKAISIYFDCISSVFLKEIKSLTPTDKRLRENGTV